MNQALLNHEWMLLLRALPEWKDEKVAVDEQRRVANFLGARGFSEHEIANLLDHRVALLAVEAYRYWRSDARSAGRPDPPKRRRSGR